MRYIEETLKTPVTFECDVLVCGGGTAGFVAALAAARNGAKTILVERFNAIGGSLTNGAGPIHSFFNVFKPFPGVEKKQVIEGIPQEIVERMMARNASYGHLEMERGGDYDSVITLIDWEVYKDVAFQMLEEDGVKVLLHTMVVGATTEDGAITGVIIENKSGRQVIAAKVVVDCTGDADVAYYAGANVVKTHSQTAVGFPFSMANVDMRKYTDYAEEHGLIYQLITGDKGSETDDTIRIGVQLSKDPAFHDFMEKNHMWGPLGFSFHENYYTYINGCTKRDVDATNAEAVSEAEIELRHQAMTWAQMMKDNLPGFEKAFVSWTPNCIGVRATRIVECEHEMTVEEICNCQRFEDEVMLYGFMDLAPKLMIKNGGYYGIPYGCFVPKKVDGLLVAGRLITSDFSAHMSTRNTGSCMAQGQAVGTAAALAATEGVKPRDLDVQKLRAVLKEQKVFLG